jgi:hypothetical protein
VAAAAYFPNAEYPRGFVGATARNVHFLLPHFEHRIRSASREMAFAGGESMPTRRVEHRGRRNELAIADWRRPRTSE